MDLQHARLTLRALLNLTWGRVGDFVAVSDVVSASGLGEEEALAALDAAASRRWCYLRGDSVAASRWGLEFAMDWTRVPELLRAILNSSGDIGKAARFDVVESASRMTKAEVHTLCQELRCHGLVSVEIVWPSDETRPLSASDLGPSVTGKGWAYLSRGCTSLDDLEPATGGGGLLDHL